MIATNTRLESMDAVPASVLQIVAKTSTNALPDRTNDINAYSYRQIQNLSGADLNWAIGEDATQDSYHGIVADKGTIIVNTRRRLSVWSLAGGKVATLELVKKDL